MSKEAPEIEIVPSSRYRLKLPPTMLAKIEEIIEEYARKRLPEIVENKLEEIVERKVKEILGIEEKEIELKVIPREEAIKKIKSYIDEHPGCLTGDIIYDLGLDPDLVLSVLEDLQKKKLIRGIPIEE